jgi:hypothetical protein
MLRKHWVRTTVVQRELSKDALNEETILNLLSRGSGGLGEPQAFRT